MKFSLPTTILLSIASLMLGSALFAGFIFTQSLRQKPPASAPFPPVLSINPDLLTAKSALVYDPSDGRILFQKDAGTSRPLASLTKLMSADIVLANTQEPLTAPVTITAADLAQEGDAGDWGFREGDVVRLGDLVKFGLVASSNDAMAAAAASLGGQYLNDMNRTAGALGLSSTYFLNPTGLDVSETTSGAYGSAQDVAKLAAAFLKSYPQFFELTANPTVTIDDSGKALSAQATAAPLLNIPGFIGAKTGYTDLAGGNLAAAVDIDINHPLIFVVLGSTESGRFNDIRMLVAAVRQSIATN